MILTPSIKLEATLAGAVAANQPEVHIDYIDYGPDGVPTFPIPNRTALNGANDVTILASPTAGHTKAREPLRVCIYNKDTAAITVTVKTDDGTTEYIEKKVTLATTESLCFEKDRGWYVLQANGAVKQGSGVTGPASSTDNAAVRWDGATGTLTQNSAFVIDDSGQVTSFGGNITFPGTQASSADANTLDDYEEGTWTPVLSFVTNGDLSVVYSVQFGSYTKIGRVATLQYGIITSTFTHTTASGNVQITGIPFAALGTAGSVTRGAVQWQGVTKANYTNIVSALVQGASTLNMNAAGSAQAASNVVAADMPTTGTVHLIGVHTHFTA